MTKSIIYHEDIVSGATPVPKDFVFDRETSRYAINPELEARLDEPAKEELKAGFMRTLQMREVYGESKVLPEGLHVGDYLIHDPQFPAIVLPQWIDGSIIRIDGYWPLAQHIGGVGIKRDHPCEMQEAGWNYEQLWWELADPMMRSWKVVDEEKLQAYCAEHGIGLVDDYSSCKATKPLSPEGFL
jgi:hypothetical protein